MKRKLIWFVKLDKHVEDTRYLATAKLRQMHDFASKALDEFDVIVIQSDENKFSFLDTEEDIKKEIGDNYNDFICRIKDKLRDCLTVNI